MRKRHFFYVLLFSQSCYAGELLIQHPSLAAISCAVLISVELFDAQKHLLTGKIKKIWGHCQEGPESKVSFSLWRPVVWDDPNVSPVEIMFSGADPSRDFKYGEQTIVIEGPGGFETFLPTPHFQKKLEIIFNKKLIPDMVNTLSTEELSEWMEDYDLGPFFSDLMMKTGKIGIPFVVKNERESGTSHLSAFFIDFIRRQTAAEKLMLLKELLDKSQLEKVEDLGRVKNVVFQELGDAEIDGWVMVIKKLDPKNQTHLALIGFQMGEIFKVENLKARPGLIAVARDLWKDLILASDEEDLISSFRTYWESLSEVGKKSFAPTVSRAMVLVGPFYQKDMFEILAREMKLTHDPYYFELLKPVWRDARFFAGPGPRPRAFDEVLDELAKKFAFFAPLSLEYKEAMKTHSKA